jgi:hypothetical protein
MRLHVPIRVLARELHQKRVVLHQQSHKNMEAAAACVDCGHTGEFFEMGRQISEETACPGCSLGVVLIETPPHFLGKFWRNP